MIHIGFETKLINLAAFSYNSFLESKWLGGIETETEPARRKRVFGYDILINAFEPFLRKFVADEIFLVQYGDKWAQNMPKGVINELLETKQIQSIDEYSMEDFFEELTFLNLKDLWSLRIISDLQSHFLGS
jgi:hypothetical protein